MIPKKYSESPEIFIAHLWFVILQLLNITYIQEGLVIKLLVLLLFGVCTIVPFGAYGIYKVRNHNNLVENGKRITTHVLLDSFQIIPGKYGSGIIKMKSIYAVDDRTYLFEGEFSCESYRRVIDYFKQHPTIDVITNDTYQKSSMIFSDIEFQSGIRIEESERTAYFNRILCGVDIILLLVNIAQEFI